MLHLGSIDVWYIYVLHECFRKFSIPRHPKILQPYRTWGSVWKEPLKALPPLELWMGLKNTYSQGRPGSTISTLLHDKINPKDCQVLSLGDSGFLQLFRVVSSDYGKPRRLDSFRGVSVFLFAHLRLSDAYLESSWWVDGGLVLGLGSSPGSCLISIVQGGPLQVISGVMGPL